MADDAQPLPPPADEEPRVETARERKRRALPDQAPGNQRLSVVPARAVGDVALSDRAFRVLALVGIWGDRKGWCWPSVARMSQRMGCSERHVQRGLAELTSRGYLERHPQGPYPNMMRIVIDAPDEALGGPEGVTDQCAPGAVDNSERGDSLEPKGVTHCLSPRTTKRTKFSSGEIVPAAAGDPAKAARKAAWQRRMFDHIRRSMRDGEAEALIAAFLANQADAVATVNRLSRALSTGARRQHRLSLGRRS